MGDAEIRVVGNRVSLSDGNGVAIEAPLPKVIDEILRARGHRPSCPVLPAGVRMWIERHDVTAVAVESPPQARNVRWLSSDSGSPYGRGATYRRYFLAFPYIILLLIFRRGSLTGHQQLYYRTAPLDAGGDLLLPNLYNVARGYGQRCWVCLANLRDVTPLSWPGKIRAVQEHVFNAAFNRSSEEHEGNSYYEPKNGGIDSRVETVDAWQEATRQNPRFALDVPWKPANTTVTKELDAMLDAVMPRLEVRSADDLRGVLTRARRRRHV